MVLLNQIKLIGGGSKVWISNLQIYRFLLKKYVNIPHTPMEQL